MSATGRSIAAGTGYERHPDDDFATPYWCTRAIMPHLKIPPGGIVLDPCCGAGAVLDVAKERGYKTKGIELSHERARKATDSFHAVTVSDTLADSTSWPQVDAGVTNPPYSIALPVIGRALSEYDTTIDLAFLLRINFLGSQKRADFHKLYPSDLYVLPKRPEFVMSVSCKKKRDCGWGVTIPFLPTGQLSSPRPIVCGKCQGPIVSSSSDATEYAWFVWGPGRGNRWFMLDLPGTST